MLRMVRCVVACCRWESYDPVQERSGSSPGDSSLQSRQEVVSSSSADCAEMVESFCFSIVERCRSLRERPERTAHEEEGGLSQELTTLQVVSISDDILSTEQSDLETDILIGCVNNTWDGFVYISETIYFSLDIVSEGFVPYKGDWLEIEYSMEPCTSNIRAHSAKPMNRNHIKELCITSMHGSHGVIANSIFFTLNSLLFPEGYVPEIHDVVNVDILRSHQGCYLWRAVSITPVQTVAF